MYKLSISLLLVYTLIGCSKSSHNENKPVNNQETSTLKDDNNKAPEFRLVSTDGKDIRLSEYKGKVVIIDFWATWCGPCRKGIPDLIELQKEFGKDIVVIGISLDTDTKEEVIPFMQKIGINYPVAYGTFEVTQQYGGVEGIPTSFVINKKGEIVGKHVGLVPKSEYTDQINKLLNKS
jgi:cytochrome c biogenesis protein CcmG/thiol:disulfide interchange protein DsbE